MRLNGELSMQKQASIGRGRTLDGLLTSPQKYRGYLDISMNPEHNTIDDADNGSDAKVTKWGGNKIIMNINENADNNPFY